MKNTKLKTVDYVDVERYMGVWYQVARYPHKFQSDDCAITTATYKLKENGKIDVTNHCWADKYGGEVTDKATATAWSVSDSNARLKVRFFWPFKADYWIIDLDEENYHYAVVSHPNMNYLWILCREPAMETELYESIIAELVEIGFDKSKIKKTSKQK